MHYIEGISVNELKTLTKQGNKPTKVLIRRYLLLIFLNVLNQSVNQAIVFESKKQKIFGITFCKESVREDGNIAMFSFWTMDVSSVKLQLWPTLS